VLFYLKSAYLTNIHCNAIHNCHNESPLYNENILIKMEQT
jgi:hypothetical protein